jgi:hypothetical protein
MTSRLKIDGTGLVGNVMGCWNRAKVEKEARELSLLGNAFEIMIDNQMRRGELSWSMRDK